MKKSILIIMAMGMLVGQVDYESQIQTIFNNNCTSCHVYGHNSGLNLTSYAGVMARQNSRNLCCESVESFFQIIQTYFIYRFLLREAIQKSISYLKSSSRLADIWL